VAIYNRLLAVVLLRESGKSPYIYIGIWDIKMPVKINTGMGTDHIRSALKQLEIGKEL
jgi:hypothetical protein